MGRVSDAMWRAENHEDEAAGAGTDEVPFASSEAQFVSSEVGGFASQPAGTFVSPTDEGGFVSGEDEEKDLAVYVFNPAERKAPPLMEPTRRRQAIPIERAPAESNSDEEIRLADALGTLFRHRWLIAIVVGISVASVVAYNSVAVPIFEARAKLIIEPNSPEVVPFRGASMEDQGRLDYFVTQIEVIRSRPLVSKTLNQLGLLKADPKAQVEQVSSVLTGLVVSPLKSELGESRVLSVSYRSTNPDLAARVVNGLTQAYVDQNLESRRQGSLAAFKSLSQRLDELRQDVTTSQGAMQRYREQKDSVALGGDQQNIVVQKLAQLSAAVTSARMDRLDKQTLYEQLKRIRQSGAPLDTFSPILSNTFVQGLKAELAGLQRERGQLSERLGEAHPDMIKVNGSIAAAERRLADEMAKIVEGVENDYNGAQAREKAMAETLEGQKREVLALSQKSIGFSALQRDAASTQQMFDTVLQRVKETELSGGLQTNNAKILDPAEVPRVVVWPRKGLNLIAALLGGFFIAIALAFTREYLNPRLAGRDDISAALGLPVLGTTPRINRLKPHSALNALPLAFQEAVRATRTRILLAPVAGAARALVVTSTNAGEGKTVISSSLATSMAMAGRRVLLVDADLRRPQLHLIHKIAKSPGLSDLLMGGVSPSDAIVESAVPGLYLLPAGAHVATPSEALDSQRLTQLIERVRDQFDVVVLDCPPVMPVADAAIIANAAGSVLFVVGSGTTSRSDAQEAIDRLSSVQAQVVGVVLNRARPDSASAYHYQPSLTEHTA